MRIASSATRYALRELLDVVPPFTVLEPYRDSNLNRWRSTGSYRCVASSNSGWKLEVNHREFASSLIADCNHLLNQVTEHRAQLLQALSAPVDPSPAWLFVTLYYMGLYSTLAWTRVVNRSVLYLDREAISKYCGGASTRPGAGSYVMQFKVGYPGETAEVDFVRSVSHFHEAVWLTASKEAIKLCEWVNGATTGRAASSDELLTLRSFAHLAKPAFHNTPHWPSKLRNAVNYRPGYAYRSVLKNNLLRVRRQLTGAKLSTFEDIVSHCDHALGDIDPTMHPADTPNEAVDLLTGLTLMLEAYAEEALDEISSVQDLACSAKRQRTTFRRAMCAHPAAALLAI